MKSLFSRNLLGATALGLIMAGNTASADHIKVGVIGTLSGVFAFFGEEMVEGIELAAEQAGYQAGDHTFELIIADDELNAEVGLTRIERLVSQDEVDIIVGPIAGFIGSAAAKWACADGTPLVIAYAAAEDDTMRDRCANVVRPGWTGAQPMFAFGEYIAQQGMKHIVMVGEDYSFPHNQMGGFLKSFCRAGGEKVTKIYHPLGQDDFASILATLPQGDAVMYNGAGTDAASFFNQYEQFGLRDQMPIIGGSNFFLPFMLRLMGDSALGGVSAVQYTDYLDTPENKAFVEAYKAAYGDSPSAPGEHGFVAMHQVMEAIAKAGKDRDAMVAALREFEFDAPRGPITIDDYGNVVQNIYINEVQKIDGELVNVPIATFEAVSQFGPYDPENYMADPRDTADFPPGDCSDPYYQE